MGSAATAGAAAGFAPSGVERSDGRVSAIGVANAQKKVGTESCKLFGSILFSDTRTNVFSKTTKILFYKIFFFERGEGMFGQR